ncbi:glucose/galactose MFS transporter [Pseudidiomarina terrestris]|uniref:glucose/galactose MFS transporter n=1 Tax=Pseudidiomarina terrestris TaxID=2820060 RepID=UPI002655285E|nr:MULTISPECIES: glucose/galactose MFS transporter [unclassified Pseudidiomarina]MDN7126101.1 glucose/galactose MFS transporter [Pseudidiomarina sp. 1APR75-33.1]MDN7134129.1 glucose/galactose MFS transporter [Pseudidiomarina sp. 1ASP75-5]MDN7137184.1 glucose/galactose MFS transporter [Pseudidiomarina sp. 1ASP75-14]MEA3588482.1 glucose/galactose MFS transporter [Pseudidiomarina sp. 1APP75-27a]
MRTLIPMTTIGILFFIFGFVTWLNGALIPFLQIISDLSEFQALLVAFCFYIAYVVMALPMSWILDHTGYKNGMVLGLALVGLGLFLFVPAAKTHYFSIFLFAQFVVGSGLTLLQTASNPYIVRIGPHESAAARIAIMGILNKLAGVFAPLFFTWLVLADFPNVSAASIAELSASERAAQVSAMAANIIPPYVGMGIAMFVLALGLFGIKLPHIREEAPSGADVHTSVLRYPQLVLGAMALFFYVGVEVIAGDTIGMYGSRLGLANYSSLTSYVMAAMVIGYVLGLLLIPRLLSQQQALTASAALGLLFSGALLMSSDTSTAIASLLWGWSSVPVVPNSVALLALLGLANAMVWPAIWPLALADLGKFTARGSAILIMGIAGGAVLPLVYGGLADAFSAKHAYLLLPVGYAVIGWYGLVGHKKRSW